jgi:hypothetical protein
LPDLGTTRGLDYHSVPLRKIKTRRIEVVYLDPTGKDDPYDFSH